MSEEVKIVISQKGTIPVYTSTRVGGGEASVHHDSTLQGSGSTGAPLGISQTTIDQINRGGDTFVFEMGEAQKDWTIQHNLDKRPSVTVVDSSGAAITCAVDYIDENTVQIHFNAPFKGFAYLN